MRVVDDDNSTAAREAIVVNEALENLHELAHVLPTLQHLNVSFNNFTHLGGVEQALQLRNLNVSHNAIVTLQEVTALSQLRVLKCSHNEIADLSWLAGLHALHELFVQHNRIERAQLTHLQGLQQLATLVLHPNPCTESASYITDVVRAMPWLECLDTVVVDDALRSDAQHASERESLSTGATDCSLSLMTCRSDDVLVPPTPDTLIQTELSAPVRKKTKQEIAEEFMRNFPVQDYIPLQQQQHGRVLDGNSDLGDDASSSPVASMLIQSDETVSDSRNQQDEVQGVSCKSLSLPVTTVLDEEPEAHMVRSELTAHAISSDDAIVAAAPPSSSHGPPTSISSIASAVLSLPTFSSDGFLKRYAPKPRAAATATSKKPKRATKGDDSAATTHSSLVASVDASSFQQNELLLAYPNSTVTAVHVRADGSALAKWPNGSVAVSVDRERDGFRVYAAHRDGAIALSLDAAGVGFINYYPSGRTMLSTTSSGDGLLFSSDGAAIVRQWDASRHVRDEHLDPTDVLGSEHDGALLCKLSDGIGVRVQLAEPSEGDSSMIGSNASCPIQLSVYFATTSGIRYRFTNSVNVVANSASDACDCVFGPLATAAATSKRESAKAAPVPHADLLHDIRAAVASLQL